jgi:hypothetical protein
MICTLLHSHDATTCEAVGSAHGADLLIEDGATDGQTIRVDGSPAQ